MLKKLKFKHHHRHRHQEKDLREKDLRVVTKRKEKHETRNALMANKRNTEVIEYHYV